MIARMAWVEIVCLRELLDDLVVTLQQAGLLHIEETPLSVEDAPSVFNRCELDPEKRAKLDKYEELERTLHEIKPLLTEKPTAQEVRNATAKLVNMGADTWERRINDWAEKLRGLTQRKAELQDHIEIMKNYQRVLSLVNPLLGSREAVLGRSARALVLHGDIARAAGQLEEQFQQQIGPECQFIKTNAGRRTLVGVVTYPEGKDETVTSVLSENGIEPLEVADSELRNAPLKDVLHRIGGAIAKREEEVAQLETELEAFSKEIAGEVAAQETLLGDELKKFRVMSQFARSQMTGVATGWCPAEDVPKLRDLIEKEYSGKAYVGEVQYDQADAHRIPTLLKNPAFFKPFEVILALFRPPTYGSYDPTVVVAISFVLFYGFILGDAVYGVAVMGFAHFLRTKWGHIPAVDSAGKVGYYMGISSIVFGVLYGEYAGNFGENVLGIGYIWFHRGHEPDDLLLYALLFGVVHVPMALIMGIREDFHHNHKNHAYEKLGLLLGLGGLGLVACNNFQVPVLGSTPALYLAAVLFIAGVVFIFRGMGKMGLVGVLEIVSLGGNVLSYSRLMALGIASVVLADLANEIVPAAGMWVGVPLAILVHCVNIVIGMASPTIHSLRLNYVEFLPKFYAPEGRKYEPFRKEALW